MSNQEAIALLRNLEDSLDAYCELNEEGKTAFRMAIEALNCSEFPNSSDTISGQQAIDALDDYLDEYSGLDEEGYHNEKWCAMSEAKMVIGNLPSAQPEKRTEERMETHACDLIDREAAVDAIYHHLPSVSRTRARTMLHEVPSAQPEPLSDAYTKAVWTWLLDYQIKAAKLKGRYTPYEVLSWVANDWRKEHEESD